VDGGTRWYRTGDAGTVVDGAVAVTGRLDRVIISGGVKVSLDAVERCVQRMPLLENAVVLAGAHEEWGETPIVVAVTEVPLARLRHHVAADLGPRSAPSRLEIVATIPTLPSGKPDRLRLSRELDLS
jgi:O-succinylbenzoic acid--CoA ligase